MLPGATVTVAGIDSAQAADSAVDPVLDTTVTDGAGAFEFAALPAGAYIVAADLSGYASGMVGPVEVVAGQVLAVRLRLEVAPLSEVVTVDASTGAGQPLEKDEFGTEFLQVFQLPTDRFQDALPLLPGVVRDPRGRLSFNGTRPSQSTLLVNGANATDPVTGQFAFELPLSVVETVEVHAVPYSAEFGRVSGAVTEVRTVSGDDHWDVNFGSLMPSPGSAAAPSMGSTRPHLGCKSAARSSGAEPGSRRRSRTDSSVPKSKRTFPATPTKSSRASMCSRRSTSDSAIVTR